MYINYISLDIKRNCLWVWAFYFPVKAITKVPVAIECSILSEAFYSPEADLLTYRLLRPSFFYFLFYRFFLQQVSVGGRNKNKSCVSFDFNSIGKWSK